MPDLKLPPNPVYSLRTRVTTPDGEGIIVARSFDRQMRYDVELTSGKVLRDLTEITLASKEPSDAIPPP
jgi:hypothetical protein